MRKWLRWLFRRGGRSVLLLNMAPGDHVVAMTPYRDLLAVATAGGEIYLISKSRFLDCWELPDMTVFRR